MECSLSLSCTASKCSALQFYIMIATEWSVLLISRIIMQIFSSYCFESVTPLVFEQNNIIQQNCNCLYNFSSMSSHRKSKHSVAHISYFFLFLAQICK